MNAAALVLTTPAVVDGPYEALTRKTNAELDAIFARSAAPDPHSLVGYEWRGFNTPRWTRLAGIQKFIKGFFEVESADGTPAGSRVEGYNLRVPQNGLHGDWTAQPTPDAPSAFGFFTVTQPRSSGTLLDCLLDYGASTRNRWWRIDDVSMKVIRDYVVTPDPKHPHILLGKALLQLGPFRVFSNYFVIERLRKAVWQPEPIKRQLPPPR